MKGKWIVAFLVIATTSAFAAELPLSGKYGTQLACFVYRSYGVEALFADGGGHSYPGGESPPVDAFFLAEAGRLTSVQYACSVMSVDGDSAVLSCVASTDEKPTLRQAKLTPVDGGFDLQLDDDEPIRLVTCDKTLAPGTELPLTEAYGTPHACYWSRGWGLQPSGIFHDGWGAPEGEEEPPEDEDFLVNPTYLTGPGFEMCDVLSVDGYDVSLSCERKLEGRRTLHQAKLTPVDGGFDLQLDDRESFRIISCEKPKP